MLPKGRVLRKHTETYPLTSKIGPPILQPLESNILSNEIFEKRPIIQIVKDAYKQEPEPSLCNQLNLFNS